jgi:serine/threonine-protein kinase SRPK3
MHELEFLLAIKDARFSYLARLHDHFELTGPHGQHLCLVMNVLGPSVQTIRMSAPTRTLAVHSVKTIVALLLEGLTELHQLGIVHTGETLFFHCCLRSSLCSQYFADIKADNILFQVDGEEAIIGPILASEPLAIEGTFELKGQSYSILHSQPITLSVKWDDDWSSAENWSISLIDLNLSVSLLPYGCYLIFTRSASSQGFTPHRSLSS